MLNRGAEKPTRRRLPGVDVRPGSVKQARADAGLSLAELAGGRVTRAAIHLVETGRSRPSMPVLEMIAERTGKPVAWFLEPSARGQARDAEREARIAELEALSEAQEHDAARKLAGELLESVHGEDEEARVRHFLGRALVRLFEPEDALPHLRRALTLFEALQDELMAVETLDWLAGALSEMEDPNALNLEEEALRRCRALDPVPSGTEIRILTNLALVHAHRHDWQRAAKLYETILQRGAEMQDLGRVARVYMGLATSYRHLGDLARAVSYTQRAVAFHSLMHDRAAVCSAEEQLGRLLLRHDDLQGAEEHLGRAIEAASQMGLERQRRRAELAMAEVYLLRGELDPARRMARESLERNRGQHQSATDAEAHTLLGRAEARAGDAKAADRHFEAALRIVEAAGLTEQLVETHHAYAGVLKDRGDTAAALAQLETAMELTRPGLSRSTPRRGSEATGA